MHCSRVHTVLLVVWLDPHPYVIIISIIFIALLLHSQGLKISKCEMYVWNGYDGDSETVNMLARHTALICQKATEICWYMNVVSHGSAVQSVTFLRISAMRLPASSDKGSRVSATTRKKRTSGELT